MKSAGFPASLVGVLYLLFASCLLLTAKDLPDRVATHFDHKGRPNGWMSRNTHLAFIAGFGLAVPLVVAGAGLLPRFLPARSFNIPHRDYWLAPERKAETVSYLFRHSLWLACGILVFIAGVHLLVVHANRQQPVHLPPVPILAWAGCLIVGLALWAIIMLRHFKRPTELAASPAAKA